MVRPFPGWFARAALGSPPVKVALACYFTCPETCLVISSMVTCSLASKNSFKGIVSIDQLFFFASCNLFFLMQPNLFGHLAAGKRFRFRHLWLASDQVAQASSKLRWACGRILSLA